ncbi:DivIVA domain-containing protein [Micromonospora zhanjiangensis]|uniref:Cell wall synthesis protein Wag31 n=1 Tax=Micromonospora zhanjiangensis TaxID=1522057 RepID=A0ABV8KJ56_9ACTN
MATVYRGGRPLGNDDPNRLTPYEIRTRSFPTRLRGLDAEQVRAFQRRVAEELTDLYSAVRLLGAENDRLRQRLRDWQSAHAQHCGRDRAARDEERRRLDRWRNQRSW